MRESESEKLTKLITKDIYLKIIPHLSIPSLKQTETTQRKDCEERGLCLDGQRESRVELVHISIPLVRKSFEFRLLSHGTSHVGRNH